MLYKMNIPVTGNINGLDHVSITFENDLARTLAKWIDDRLSTGWQFFTAIIIGDDFIDQFITPVPVDEIWVMANKNQWFVHFLYRGKVSQSDNRAMGNLREPSAIRKMMHI